MKSSGAILTDENDARVAELRARLDEFYATTKEYSDFKAENYKDQYWGPVRRAVEETIARKGSCDVLEFGAGRTGFARYVGALRDRTRITVQDVTPANRDHLSEVSDRVHIGDLLEVAGPFDVIFSTFVWEHITNPRRVLEHLLGCLAPGGELYIAAPKYDFPGYIPPSARHYPRGRQWAIGARIALRRLRTALGGRPAFWVHVDPAVLRVPWFVDSDAVHWSSEFDLRRALPREYRMEKIPFEHRNFRQWVFGRLLLLFVRIKRSPGAADTKTVVS